MIDAVKTVFGTGVFVLALITCYQYFRILKNVYRHEDFAMTLLFLDDAAPRAFQVLLGVGIAYASGSLIIGVGTLHNWFPGILFQSFGSVLSTHDVLFVFVPKTVTIIGMLGVIYFQRSIFTALTPPSERQDAA